MCIRDSYNTDIDRRVGRLRIEMQSLNSISKSTELPLVGVRRDDTEFAPKSFRWTRDEYYGLAESGIFDGKRVELIEGEIIEMAPMGPSHATGISLVAEILLELFGKGFHLRSQTPLDVDKYSQPEPDLAVVKGKPRDYLKGHPKTLVLAVEVANSSLTLDREAKTRLYAKAGIEDYWIVNLQDRCLEVYRKPTNDPNLGFIYSERTVFGENQSVSPLAKPKSRIKVADILP